MFRNILVSLLVVAAAAEDQPTSNSQPIDKVYQTLNLNQEQTSAAKDGENRSVEFLAYQKALGQSEDQPSCVSWKVDPKHVKFTLYSMPTKSINWTGDETKTLLPYFDPELPTQILINGRQQSEQVWQPANLAFTYGIRGNKMNLITVNWNEYANCQYAVSAVLIVPQIATVVSDMIQNTLVGQNRASYNHIRLTGFGFGAHMAGLVARKLPEQIPRLTALDPAGLLYNWLPHLLKLKKGDAKFIDTVMTNRGMYGLSELVGDINFMPSGGRMQKACEKLTEGKHACSHHLALEYYVESVNKGLYGFIAKPADSWAEFLAQKTFVKYSEVMGENVSQKRFGNFYLDVNDKAPYSKGVDGAYLFHKIQPLEQQSQKQNA